MADEVSKTIDYIAVGLDCVCSLHSNSGIIVDICDDNAPTHGRLVRIMHLVI